MSGELVAFGESTELEVQSPQEMALALAHMKQKLALVQTFFKEVMVPDQDYGIIQGTDKPTLYKSGAEKLCELYGFSPKVAQVEEQSDMDTGFYRARVTVALVHRRTGTVVAEGVGEANTREGRYRWRWTPEWKLPKGIDTSSLQGEKRRDKKGREYMMYKIENDDPWTLWNTVLKMAKKRALVDAALSATRSSGLFTQDMEDLQKWAHAADDAPEVDVEFEPEPTQPVRRKAQAQQPPQPASEVRTILGEVYAMAASLKISAAAMKQLLQERYGKTESLKLTLEEAEDLRGYLADMQAVVEQNAEAEAGK